MRTDGQHITHKSHIIPTHTMAANREQYARHVWEAKLDEAMEPIWDTGMVVGYHQTF